MCVCVRVQVRASLRAFTVEAIAESDTAAGRESSRLRAKAMAKMAVLREEKEVSVCVCLCVCTGKRAGLCLGIYRTKAVRWLCCVRSKEGWTYL